MGQAIDQNSGADTHTNDTYYGPMTSLTVHTRNHTRLFTALPLVSLHTFKSLIYTCWFALHCKSAPGGFLFSII